MKIDPAAWPTLSKLLDEWLDLPEESRNAWLESLTPQYDHVLPALRQMLQKQASGFLDPLSTFTGGPGTFPARGLMPGDLVGRYRLLRELGAGGMGVVWLAEGGEGALQRQVALKIPHAAAHNPALSERFSRERDILEQLTHPHIARLYDAGVTAGGQPYLVLEYVEGESITSYCDRHRLDTRRRLVLFVHVLRAVQYAHMNLVVHRDLKPSNILVTGQGEVRLLDFGIAKLLTDGEARESDLTRIGGRALTPDYASPEQVTGGVITTATDVYSLGVLFCELLTGERPYKLKHTTPIGLEDAILTAEPVRPSQSARDETRAQARAVSAKKLASTLKGDLDTIAIKSLQKNPQARYATADAFAADIQRYLRGAPVLARAESSWYRARKFVLRNKLAVGSATAVVAALGIGLGIALREAHHAQVQARTAQAVRVFLQDIFVANSSANPDPVKARQTTARELLDLGANRLDTALADAPEAKLRVIETLSGLYTDLGLKERAVAIKRTRVQLAKSVYGTSSPEAAEALVDLAVGLGESSSTNDRESVIREAERTLDQIRDFTSGTRATLYQAEALLYMDTDLSKSVDAASKAVHLLRTGGPSRALVQAATTLGQALTVRKQYREAITALSEAAQAAGALDGEAKVLLPEIYAYLGENQNRVLDIREAEKSYRLSLESARKFDGEEHENTLQTKQRLGAFLVGTARPEEGLRLMKEAVELALRTKGPNDVFHTAGVTFTYGRFLVFSGRIEEGLAFLHQSAAILRRGNRTGIRTYFGNLERQAEAETILGHYPQAVALLAESDAFHASVHDTAASGLLNGPLLIRARLLTATGKAEEAAKILEPFPEDANSRDLPLAQAEIDLARGQYEEALRLASHARSQIEVSDVRAYLKHDEAEAALVEGQALLRTNGGVEALPLLERAVQLSSEVYDPAYSPELARAQVALGECLLSLGRRDQARDLLARAKEIHSKHKELGPHLANPLHSLEAGLAL